jgi:hypothetical protein
LKGRTVAIVIAPVVISMAVAGQRLSTPGPGLLIDAPLSQQEVLIGSFGRLGLQPFPENLVRPARAFAILLGRQAGTTHLLLLFGQEAGVATKRLTFQSNVRWEIQMRLQYPACKIPAVASSTDPPVDADALALKTHSWCLLSQV